MPTCQTLLLLILGLWLQPQNLGKERTRFSLPATGENSPSLAPTGGLTRSQPCPRLRGGTDAHTLPGFRELLVQQGRKASPQVIRQSLFPLPCAMGPTKSDWFWLRGGLGVDRGDPALSHSLASVL